MIKFLMHPLMDITPAQPAVANQQQRQRQTVATSYQKRKHQMPHRSTPQTPHQRRLKPR